VARRLGTLLAVALLAVPVAGCGGDEESAEGEPKRPELTVPGGASTEPETSESTQTAPATTPPPQTTPPSTQPPARTAPDSPQNDRPPPAGSPAERFEKFCNENPGACG
jgi:hypothetical protein